MKKPLPKIVKNGSLERALNLALNEIGASWGILITHDENEDLSIHYVCENNDLEFVTALFEKLFWDVAVEYLESEEIEA